VIDLHLLAFNSNALASHHSNRPEFSSNLENHAPEGTVLCHQLKKYLRVPRNPRDPIQKPNETHCSGPKWLPCRMPEVTNYILRNTVTYHYVLKSTRKVRTQPLTAGWVNISRHFIQVHPMTHLIKGLRKVRRDRINLTPVLNLLQNKIRISE
jgi:hypothetical protein